MSNWIKELALGSSLAFILLALILGFDLTQLILPISLLALGTLIFKRSPLGQNGFQQNLKLGEGEIPDVHFSSIGGQDSAKREFIEALDFLKENEKLKTLGIRPLKGILLVGPPGTGKTLMAKAAANYTESAFVTASGAEFVQMYAGVGANRVRQLFKEARSLAKQMGKSSAIIFIDEIDVLGAKRGQSQSHMEYDQTLNEFLAQIDGIQSGNAIQILVVGATNRAEILDPALLRPGRFDRIVPVQLPDQAGRFQILKIHSKNKPLASDVCLKQIAEETAGFSGAHLENLLNEAAIYAWRAGHEVIGLLHLREGIDKVMLGEKTDRSLDLNERERVAFHEIGHALMSELVKPGSVASVTITPRNNALGYIRQTPQKDQYLYTKDELLAAIQVSLAGTVTEELIFGQRSTGALGDIEQATNLAKQLILSGLSPLGIVSADLAKDLVQGTIREIIQVEEEKVAKELGLRIEKIKRLAKELLREESMDGQTLRNFIGNELVS